MNHYILNIDGIRNCRVYAKKNNLIGNLLLCDVVAGEKLSSKHIMNELLKDLPKYKIPRFINFVNDLEKTKVGKDKKIMNIIITGVSKGLGYKIAVDVIKKRVGCFWYK